MALVQLREYIISVLLDDFESVFVCAEQKMARKRKQVTRPRDNRKHAKSHGTVAIYISAWFGYGYTICVGYPSFNSSTAARK